MFEATFWVLLWEFAGSLIIHWIGLIPRNWLWGFSGEILRLLLPVFRIQVAYGTAFFAGTKVNRNSLSRWKVMAIWILVLTLVSSFSLYWFGYMRFKSRVERAGITYLGYSPKRSADVFLQAETGSKGVIGYFLNSLQQEARVDIGDETLTIPRSDLANVVNWILQSLTIIGTIIVAYRGSVSGMTEKVLSIKEDRNVSYDKISDRFSDAMENLTYD